MSGSWSIWSTPQPRADGRRGPAQHRDGLAHRERQDRRRRRARPRSSRKGSVNASHSRRESVRRSRRLSKPGDGRPPIVCCSHCRSITCTASSTGWGRRWPCVPRARSCRRCADSSSVFSCSICSLIFVAPCRVAFSAFHTSSRSLNSRSSVAMSLSRSASRFFDSASFSFFSASRWIFSWISRRSLRSSSSGLESISMRIRDAASSIRSIALSGSWRSAM